jgi:hypothetical protein
MSIAEKTCLKLEQCAGFLYPERRDRLSDIKELERLPYDVHHQEFPY